MPGLRQGPSAVPKQKGERSRQTAPLTKRLLAFVGEGECISPGWLCSLPGAHTSPCYGDDAAASLCKVHAKLETVHFKFLPAPQRKPIPPVLLPASADVTVAQPYPPKSPRVMTPRKGERGQRQPGAFVAHGAADFTRGRAHSPRICRETPPGAAARPLSPESQGVTCHGSTYQAPRIFRASQPF